LKNVEIKMFCIIIKTFNESNSILTQGLAANFDCTTIPTKPVFFLAATFLHHGCFG